MHVAIYARVSTADKHPRAGTRNPETRLRPMREYLAAMPKAPTASAFVDHVSSGVSRSLGSAAT